VNDLLRTMLDMGRASNNQLSLTLKPTSVMGDVLEPVDSLLSRRGRDFEVILDCQPPDLVVLTDPLRLKQTVLNLARNSAKFVPTGGKIFLRAAVVDGLLQLAVGTSYVCGVRFECGAQAHLHDGL